MAKYLWNTYVDAERGSSPGLPTSRLVIEWRTENCQKQLVTASSPRTPSAHPTEIGRHPKTLKTLASRVEKVELWQQRRASGRLSDFHLKDIGISRADAEREIAKPFWER